LPRTPLWELTALPDPLAASLRGRFLAGERRGGKWNIREEKREREGKWSVLRFFFYNLTTEHAFSFKISFKTRPMRLVNSLQGCLTGLHKLTIN